MNMKKICFLFFVMLFATANAQNIDEIVNMSKEEKIKLILQIQQFQLQESLNNSKLLGTFQAPGYQIQEEQDEDCQDCQNDEIDNFDQDDEMDLNNE